MYKRVDGKLVTEMIMYCLHSNTLQARYSGLAGRNKLLLESAPYGPRRAMSIPKCDLRHVSRITAVGQDPAAP